MFNTAVYSPSTKLFPGSEKVQMDCSTMQLKHSNLAEAQRCRENRRGNSLQKCSFRFRRRKNCRMHCSTGRLIRMRPENAPNKLSDGTTNDWARLLQADSYVGKHLSMHGLSMLGKFTHTSRRNFLY